MESDLKEMTREFKEREESLEEVMKEVALFNLHEEEELIPTESDCESEIGKINDECFEGTIFSSHGVKIFSGYANYIYDKDQIFKEAKSEKILNWLGVEKLNSSLYMSELYLKVSYEYSLKSSTMKFKTFRLLLRLLFTEQSFEYVDKVSHILLQIINQVRRVEQLFDIFMEELPLGILNLGADRKIMEGILTTLPQQNGDIQQKEFVPVNNISYVFRIFQNLLAHITLFPESCKLKLDKVIYLLFIVSQDNYVTDSTLIYSIQNLLALLIDLYPSDSDYQEKVQDLVDSFADFWDSLPGEFNHFLASFVTCSVIPLSQRGLQLKSSLAFYSIMCCVTPEEVDVLDIVHVSTLSNFILKHQDKFLSLDCVYLYSVVKLIDAAIDRSTKTIEEKECIKKIMNCVNIFMTSAGDVSVTKTSLNVFIKEVNTEWSRLVDSEDSGNFYTKRKKTVGQKLGSES